MLFFTASMGKSLSGQYSYGKKLRSSQSFDFKMYVIEKNGKHDYELINTLISAVQKIVIKEVVEYVDEKISTTKLFIK